MTKPLFNEDDLLRALINFHPIAEWKKSDIQFLSETLESAHEAECPYKAAMGESKLHWFDQTVMLIQENARLREALRGIIEIGKRNMSNPKYDGYFEEARTALGVK